MPQRAGHIRKGVTVNSATYSFVIRTEVKGLDVHLIYTDSPDSTWDRTNIKVALVYQGQQVADFSNWGVKEYDNPINERNHATAAVIAKALYGTTLVRLTPTPVEETAEA